MCTSASSSGSSVHYANRSQRRRRRSTTSIGSTHSWHSGSTHSLQISRVRTATVSLSLQTLWRPSATLRRSAMFMRSIPQHHCADDTVWEWCRHSTSANPPQHSSYSSGPLLHLHSRSGRHGAVTVQASSLSSVLDEREGGDSTQIQRKETQMQRAGSTCRSPLVYLPDMSSSGGGPRRRAEQRGRADRSSRQRSRMQRKKQRAEYGKHEEQTVSRVTCV